MKRTWYKLILLILSLSLLCIATGSGWSQSKTRTGGGGDIFSEKDYNEMKDLATWGVGSTVKNVVNVYNNTTKAIGNFFSGKKILDNSGGTDLFKINKSDGTVKPFKAEDMSFLKYEVTDKRSSNSMEMFYEIQRKNNAEDARRAQIERDMKSTSCLRDPEWAKLFEVSADVIKKREDDIAKMLKERDLDNEVREMKPKVKGSFANGKIDGLCSYYYENDGSLEYAGQCSNGQKNGKGSSYYPDGKAKCPDTYWKDGEIYSGECYYYDAGYREVAEFSEGRKVRDERDERLAREEAERERKREERERREAANRAAFAQQLLNNTMNIRNNLLGGRRSSYTPPSTPSFGGSNRNSSQQSQPVQQRKQWCKHVSWDGGPCKMACYDSYDQCANEGLVAEGHSRRYCGRFCYEK